jgi:hypothetical protein
LMHTLEDRRVVVSTATLTLQSQLVDRDVPALLDATEKLLRRQVLELRDWAEEGELGLIGKVGSGLDFAMLEVLSAELAALEATTAVRCVDAAGGGSAGGALAGSAARGRGDVLGMGR